MAAVHGFVPRKRDCRNRAGGSPGGLSSSFLYLRNWADASGTQTSPLFSCHYLNTDSRQTASRRVRHWGILRPCGLLRSRTLLSALLAARCARTSDKEARLREPGKEHQAGRPNPARRGTPEPRDRVRARGCQGDPSAVGQVAIRVRAHDRGERLDPAKLGARATPPGRASPCPVTDCSGQPQGGGGCAGEVGGESHAIG